MIIDVHFIQARQLFVSKCICKSLPFHVPDTIAFHFVHFTLKTSLMPGSLGQCQQSWVDHRLELTWSSNSFGPERASHSYKSKKKITLEPKWLATLELISASVAYQIEVLLLWYYHILTSSVTYRPKATWNLFVHYNFKLAVPNSISLDFNYLQYFAAS